MTKTVRVLLGIGLVAAAIAVISLVAPDSAVELTGALAFIVVLVLLRRVRNDIKKKYGVP